MKKINLILRKCKSLSRQLGRSSSYSSLRSNSSRDHYRHEPLGGHSHRHTVQLSDHPQHRRDQIDSREIIFVGSTRKRYLISSKYLSHPLLNALIEKPSNNNKLEKLQAAGGNGNNGNILLVKCEVVLFDHLLWMLDNSDDLNLSSESLEELAALYIF
ncbi:auxin-responsive protein SAUR76 [Punica granatum]|uniref:Uncharacterized protein n=2 Tax=Punica granatum TaxID=22663 RepID=A0A218XUL4_PUNGR|nr:auxin-responsive protein SAUR76 [Punica granatum]XP_031403978.1 auxin-responsive protein SAUR76 [Punica granatum]OWM88530.1 hypothetical protein CDL15_Pgr002297 [Punica granatum]PKI49143.1 hypothetical protein CRG98_030489 [Punica granatum]